MSSKIKIPIKPTYDCRICGGLAEYKCFGVFACHPCKIFFKRNANTGQVFLIFIHLSSNFRFGSFRKYQYVGSMVNVKLM